MNNIDNIGNLNTFIYILKTFFFSICTYYTFLKLIKIKIFSKFELIKESSIIALITIFCGIIRYTTDAFTTTLFLILLLSFCFAQTLKYKFGYTILVTIIALSINFIIFFITIIINYMFNSILIIQNDYINLILMMINYLIFIFLFSKIKRFKNGLLFLQKNLTNDFFDILILNTSIVIIFLSITWNNFDLVHRRKIFFGFIAFAIIMFISIQKTLTMYYKHKLLVTELEETKSELKQKNGEIAKLEEENLNFSKTSHSIAHKLKSLEYKLNELMLKNEISSEIDIKDRIDNISNQCFNHTATIELSKTNIPEIDDMLSYMQSECTKNNIDFDLQLHGNIYTMTNNFISKEDLEILLADHIKNAIIAINYSDNVNRSILVRLGMIDGYYSVFVYDSGIEFKIDTLTHLGQKPSTTHSDSGGTGMGFMNTFDTLRKYQASLYINENGAPTADDFTKSIVIKFDKQNKFEIHSYRAEKIENINNNLIIKNK